MKGRRNEYEADESRTKRPEDYPSEEGRGTAYLRLLACEDEEQAIADCGCTLTREDDGDVALHLCKGHDAGPALLEALERSADALARDGVEEDDEAVYEEVEAAIAKARGTAS